MIAVGIVFTLAWRRAPAHPVLLMVVATTSIIVLDPITNWSPFGVYNPQPWHLPED
jgi:xanthosine utilization system XapX-like protein